MADKVEPISRDRFAKDPKPDAHVRQLFLVDWVLNENKRSTRMNTKTDDGPNIEDENTESSTEFVID